jgi:NADPH-dependent curcumin reductase CurA
MSRLVPNGPASAEVSVKPVISREVRLVSRPRVRPSLSDFEVVATELSQLQPGQLLVRNAYMSLDAYMQARMLESGSPLPAFELGEPLEGAAVGEVVASTASGYAPGDAVTSMFGWREYFVTSPSLVRRVDRGIQPLSAYLGVLGSPGLTAWAGLRVAEVRPHENVFVSAAAGAVGHIAGQLAKLCGCRVYGSTNSREAARALVHDLGFDGAFSEDTPSGLLRELAAVAPDGVDVYFDAVGGAPLDAVLPAMRPRGRIVTSGAISALGVPAQLQDARARDLFLSKGLTMKGFRVSDWVSLARVFQQVVGEHWMQGRLRGKETIVKGIERAPEAFIALLHDDSAGKVLVSLTQ